MAVSKRLRYEILRRDNNTCRYCGRSAPEVKLTIDHVVPEALGGNDEPSNLVTACEDCNSGKTSTMPDAPLVADVADDAARWARAQQVAIDMMMKGLSGNEQIHAQFEAAWDTHCEKARRYAPRPADWRQTVDAFVQAGMPVEIVLSAVRTAMSVRTVEDDSVFRYMCGIVWAKVKKLRETTAQIAARDQAPVPGGQDVTVDDDAEEGLYESGRHSLAIDIVEPFLEHQLEELRAAALESKPDDVDENSDEFVILMALGAPGVFHSHAMVLHNAVRDLLAQVPADQWLRCELAAKEDARHSGKPVTSFGVRAQTARRVAAEQAQAYLDTLPELERDEWLLGSKVSLSWLRKDVDIEVPLSAAWAARAFKSGKEAAAFGMCQGGGQHGAMCTRRSCFEVWLEDCAFCQNNGDCAGHKAWCEPHTIEFLDRPFNGPDGKPFKVRDFVKFEPEEAPF